MWVTDVTYIKYSNKFAYLSILKGVKTGFIVGYKVSERNDNKLYMDTWKEAQQYHDKSKPKIIHSDNGYQYTSIWIRRFSKRENLFISLSRPGNSIDKAAAETFFSQLKTEYKHVLYQKTFSDVCMIVDEYIR
ncbi:DDE-type integrase/transposase/recombinase [Spiroplasma endosymbiont of Aspidapion aeneum]|uniref:DDE-type integrase/transposase/recombinase n=1 Tax=Spiroplasma endosymbiont of Aspidapion aeneum TaxID=3066276 RepID=UPI00313ABB74